VERENAVKVIILATKIRDGAADESKVQVLENQSVGILKHARSIGEKIKIVSLKEPKLASQ